MILFFDNNDIFDNISLRILNLFYIIIVD